MDKIMLELDERALILFNAMPIGCNLWDKNVNIIESNPAILSLYGVADKDEYARIFFSSLMPKFQPDGEPSAERGAEIIQEAFKTGYKRLEWMYQTKDGELLPLDTILVRVKYKGEDALAAYVRDLREEKKMQADFQKAVEEKNALINLSNILNSLDAMVYVTDPETDTLIFINETMKNHFGFTDNYEGRHCFELYQQGFKERCSFCPCFKLEKEPDKPIVWEEQVPITGHFYRNSDRLITLPNGKKVHLQHSVDITDIKKMTEQLIDAKEFAEQSSQYKSAFLANMSHEIRTPMNAILGISEIQLQTDSLSADTKEAFNKIYESGNLLLNIINDILDLSKIEAGKMEIIPVKYDVPSLIHDTIQINRLRYESKPIEFLLNVDENLPLNLFGDELRIKQVLNNILSNAFKYTDKGEIKMTVFSEPLDGDTVNIIFRVSDTGQGMTEEQIKMFFSEYTRFNLKANRTTVGTGLGMSITKHLVSLMNGEVSVESEKDKGTVITVRLPQKRLDSLVCTAEIADKLRNFSFRSRAIVDRSRVIREHMPYGKVLVVDDVVSNLYVAKGLLLPYGLNIETASSGFEAIEKIKSGCVYDIIFMDHMMPKMDGIEATKIIRGTGYTGFIIALTANALIGQQEVFLNNGFDDFISKPIDSRDLNSVLNEYIRNKKPPEVIEAARKKNDEKETKPVNEEQISTEMFFLIDAENTVNFLDGFCTKLDTLGDTDINDYEIIVHGIKGALANIGEAELSGYAYKLELAAKDKNLSVISDETPAFINALNSLIKKFRLEHQKIKNEVYNEFIKATETIRNFMKTGSANS